MQIQGRLHFSRDDVTCVPVDPALSAYTDRLAFDEEALAFRIRLFGARVSKGGPAACVALVLPRDLVLCSAEAPGGVPEGQTADFDGSGAFDLHVVTTGPVDRPYRIAVERLVIDEVIAFARSFGLYPVEVVIPTPESDDSVTLPIENDQPLIEGVASVRAPNHGDGVIAEMPEAVRRELLKRQMQKDRQSPRARRSWSISALIPGRPVLGQAMAPAAATRLASAVSDILVPLVDSRGASYTSASSTSAPAISAPAADAVGAAPVRATIPAGTADAPPHAARNAQPTEPAPITQPKEEAVAKAPTVVAKRNTVDRPPVEISAAPAPVPAPASAPIAAQIATGPVTDTPARATLRATTQRAVARIMAMPVGLAARMRATARRVTTAPASMARTLNRLAQPSLARLSRFDWHRFARPAPLAVAGVFGILAVVGHVLTDRFGPQGSVPVILTSTAPERPTSAPIPQLAPLATTTETLDASARSAAMSPGRITAGDLAESVVAPTASPAAAPILVTQSASAAHGRRSVTPEPLSTTPRYPVRPHVTLAAAPTGWTDPAPMRSAPAFPEMPEAEALTGMARVAEAPPPAPAPRALAQAAAPALPAAEPPLSEPRAMLLAAPVTGPVLSEPGPAPVQAANPSTPLVLTASATPAPAVTVAPRIADRVAPRPRPTAAALDARTQWPAPPAADLATPAPGVSAAPSVALAPAQPTQRPVARPASLQAGTGIPAPVPAVTLASETAPAAQPPAARLEVIAPDGPSGLEVLAIVGTGTARQALVRTGPSQTAVLVAGASLASWQVVEVRRDGVVLTRAGREGFLPFDR